MSRSFSHALFVPVAPVELIRDVKKAFEAEVTTTETRTYKQTIISADRTQDGTRLSEIRPSQVTSLSEREGEDDWFVLFDVTREKPAVAPPGTRSCQRARAHCAQRFASD